MASITLFQNAGHRNILLEDFGRGQAVQANQHLIVHNGEGMILDPGGHKVYTRAMSESASLLGDGELKLIFFSHQDPDVIAAANGWLMTTEATAWISALWVRFVPHFGLDQLVTDRLKAIPDEGMRLTLGGSELLILPAHFLHSPGNFQVYDPVSRILYTGDLGASLGMDYQEVRNFAAHLPYMEGFHRRYMASNKVLRSWADMVRGLDIDLIAPQHGAYFRGKEMVGEFVDWCAGLPAGVDLLPPFRIPR
jgi:flavorubredoxin